MDEAAKHKGTLTVNDGIYDIYENTRENQSSIKGTTNFQQYFSIRRDKRSNGTINITDHFKKWEEFELELGKMYEVSFVVEGYMSSGNFEFIDLDVTVTKNTVNIQDNKYIMPNIKVFPNPCIGSVTFMFQEQYSDASLNIYDALGCLIFSQKNVDTNILTVSNLKSGIYFVNLKSNKLNYNTKILVY